jgi:threonine dehydratase
MISTTIDNIREAYKRIHPFVKHTPLIRAEGLEPLCGGATIYLKLENLQMTGSFKLRGVANKMLSMRPEDMKHGVTTASSGNHALAVAYMSSRLGNKALAVMPENAPDTKVESVKRYGTETVLYGLTGEDREQKCRDLMDSYGYALIHSHTDPLVIAGHGTVIIEIAEQLNDMSFDYFDEIIVPCGAGSLAGGAALAAKHYMPKTHLTAVEPAAVPRFSQSLKAGRAMSVTMGQTLADGLRVSKAEKINYTMIRDHVDRLLVIEESPIRRAVRETALYAKVVAEPSACVGIAAALEGQINMQAGRHICFIITGGNADASTFSHILGTPY